MSEKTIKIDEHTDELVTQLAYFMRGSKKSIVREAVADFAESRHRRAGGSVAAGTAGGLGALGAAGTLSERADVRRSGSV